MVSGLVSVTYEQRLRELGLLTLEQRRTNYDLVQVHKIMQC